MPRIVRTPPTALFLVLLLVTPGPNLTAEPSQPTGDVDVYLLIGQSNMAGRAPITEELQDPIPGVFLLDDKDEWQPAANPLNIHSTIRKGPGMQRLGPGYSFAATLAEKRPDRSVGLVVNARGGSKISQWKKGARYYAEAIRRTRAAAESGTVRGILWHQGEGDRDNPDYLAELEQLIRDLRADLDSPELPFVAGQINGVPLINKQLARLPETTARTGCARSTGLEAFDRWHFDTPSILLLGRRYAELMLEIQDAHASNGS